MGLVLSLVWPVPTVLSLLEADLSGGGLSAVVDVPAIAPGLFHMDCRSVQLCLRCEWAHDDCRSQQRDRGRHRQTDPVFFQHGGLVR